MLFAQCAFVYASDMDVMLSNFALPMELFSYPECVGFKNVLL